jgi:hypothetical protein
MIDRPGSARAASGPAITGVDLSNHPVPFPGNVRGVCHFDQEWLDTQARRYWTDHAQYLNRPLDAYDRADFWFRYIAVPLQDKAMRGQSVGTGANRVEKDLALIHLVGYYGGIWFGKKLVEFRGKSTTARRKHPLPSPPASLNFALMVRTLRKGIAAARTDDDAVALRASEKILRSGYYPIPTARGLIGGYGYNVGYIDAILRPGNRALPPPMNPDGPPLGNPPWNSFVFTEGGVFDATYPVWADAATAASTAPMPAGNTGFSPVQYLSGDAPAIAMSRALFHQAAAEHPDEFERIRAGAVGRAGEALGMLSLDRLSKRAFRTGKTMWTGNPLFSIKPWDAPSYNLLIGLSVYFLQAVQAAGQACMAAAAAADGPRARNALLAALIGMPYAFSYGVALVSGKNEPYAGYTADESIPPFTFDDGRPSA